jgi:hypothetical protein
MQEPVFMGHGPAAGEAERLARLISDQYGVPFKAIVGRDRDAVPAAARHLVVKTLRKKGFSLTAIGQAMDRNHTSVLRSTRVDDADVHAALAKGIRSRVLLAAAQAALKEEADIPVVEGEACVGDRARLMWDRALAHLREIPEALRPEAWERYARTMFPHDWKRQAATLPRL